jgi:hypothetical protein
MSTRSEKVHTGHDLRQDASRISGLNRHRAPEMHERRGAKADQDRRSHARRLPADLALEPDDSAAGDRHQKRDPKWSSKRGRATRASIGTPVREESRAHRGTVGSSIAPAMRLEVISRPPPGRARPNPRASPGCPPAATARLERPVLTSLRREEKGERRAANGPELSSRAKLRESLPQRSDESA